MKNNFIEENSQPQSNTVTKKITSKLTSRSKVTEEIVDHVPKNTDAINVTIATGEQVVSPGRKPLGQVPAGQQIQNETERL